MYADVYIDTYTGWSGAELAGLVRSATSFALQRALDSLEFSASPSTTSPSSPSSSSSSSSTSISPPSISPQTLARAAGLEVRVSAEDLLRAHHEIEEARPRRRRWSFRASARALFGR